MLSSFQKMLYNKLADEQLTQFVIGHIKTNCYCDAFSNKYHTFKRSRDRNQLIDFMLYLYTERRGYDIKPILKKYFTKDSYGDIKFSYQKVKKYYIEDKRLKKVQV